MTEVLKKIVVNCETGVAEEVDLTPEEIAELEAVNAQASQQLAEQEAEAAQKAADKAAGIEALKALGLTDAQINAMIG